MCIYIYIYIYTAGRLASPATRAQAYSVVVAFGDQQQHSLKLYFYYKKAVFLLLSLLLLFITAINCYIYYYSY